MTSTAKRKRGRRLVDGVEMDWSKAKRLNRWRRNVEGPHGLEGLLMGAEQRRDGTWRVHVREYLSGDTSVLMAGGEVLEVRPNPYWRQA